MGEPGERTRSRLLLTAQLARRLEEPDVSWLDCTRSLAAQGIGSLDLIVALARLQRDAHLGLPEEFVIDADTSIMSVAAALRPLARAQEG